MQERYDHYKENPGYDCPEIAEDLYNVTNGNSTLLVKDNNIKYLLKYN